MAMDELNELVPRSAAGDVKAFALLVQRFQHMACAYAYSVLGDFHLAEDAAQEAFVDAYRLLGELREPEAFPGWFRRIVYKHCDRLTRRRRSQVPLDAVAEPVAEGVSPAAEVERRETEAKVQAAIDTLSEAQREVTMLFYIQRHSQQEIAAFLQVPLTTVKKRLVDARKKLKERMLDMVSDTLRENAPDALFSEKIIEQLRARPRPLEIEGHPLRRVWQQIQAELSDWEVLGDSDEAVERKLYPSVQDAMDRISDESFQVGGGKVLRRNMTHTTFQAIADRQAPVHLLAAGRCFRYGREEENEKRIYVFYQAEGICVAPGVDQDAMRRVLEQVLQVLLGDTELRWHDEKIDYVDGLITVEAQYRGEWLSVAGCGVLKGEMLRQAGYDPDAVSGYGFGIGLERVLQIREEVEDIRDLWKPPYVGGN